MWRAALRRGAAAGRLCAAPVAASSAALLAVGAHQLGGGSVVAAATSGGDEASGDGGPASSLERSAARRDAERTARNTKRYVDEVISSGTLVTNSPQQLQPPPWLSLIVGWLPSRHREFVYGVFGYGEVLEVQVTRAIMTWAVEFAIEMLKRSVKSWNDPRWRGMLCGQPIYYRMDDTMHSLHHHQTNLNHEWMEVATDVLLEDPRINFGVIPDSIERGLYANLMHVLVALCADLTLSTGNKVCNGTFVMRWEQQAEGEHDVATARALALESLRRIDFDALDRYVDECASSGMAMPGGKAVCRNGFVIALVAFHMFFSQTTMSAAGFRIYMGLPPCDG